MSIEAVLNFWFEELGPEQWFNGGESVDQAIADRFSQLHQEVKDGEHADWRESLRGRLAEIIVLDQFSRNLYRGSGQAYAQDDMALALAQECIRLEDLSSLSPEARSFIYMPFMHSESLVIHDQAMELFSSEEALANNLKYEKAHYEIIEKYGRYPYRNETLGRENTPEEEEYLKHNKGF
ncbi:DUF924 family protein [Aerococcus sanguinicola]|uniref:DUF924 domain-containing protein n=1 Tax=Aerococcus sanguinicola TaxID=119206 RepID=A0A120I9C2_9LACT|nr:MULTISPECIES: DUF924 family protein [Aerococcus]AMB94479.1 hypothetical protein AWM72_06820 [Aerococcus sanguinicola]MDK7049355.1 DUF924 family protein [Aerococcus sanguinicola]OFT95731.1 hypothetical protein HMPREF3090_03975 [Aerococcus sp. HMSC23C02]